MSRTHPREIVPHTETGVAGKDVAVLIPCYNEELTVARVVARFRKELPHARVYVFDNNSTDQTVAEARAAGAEVFHELRRGKGYVVQSMFRQVDAAFYVMVDGDDTYPPAAVHALLAPIVAGEADMTVGSRLHAQSQSQFKRLNRLGNRLLRLTLNMIFRVELTDVLSGYRAFSREFVKSLPLVGGGFELEPELTIKAVQRGYRLVEVPVDLTHRPLGSHSKIHYFRDGFVVFNTTFALCRDYKPLTFFGSLGIFLLLVALAGGVAGFFELGGTLPGNVLMIASIGVLLCGLLCLTAGLILHSIAHRSQEFEYQIRVLRDQLNATQTPATEDARRSDRMRSIS